MPSHPEWTFTLDQDPIHTFDDDQKVAWMQGRIEKMLLIPLRDPAVRTRFNQAAAQSYDLNLGMMTLACCALEALGRFYLGGSERTNACPECGREGEEPSAARCFRQFVKRYLPAFKPMADVLYGRFRSALAHSFAIHDGSLTHDLGRAFVKKKDTSPHKIDYDRFIADLDAGIILYFDDLRADRDLRRNFLKHWDREYEFWTSSKKQASSTTPPSSPPP